MATRTVPDEEVAGAPAAPPAVRTCIRRSAKDWEERFAVLVKEVDEDGGGGGTEDPCVGSQRDMGVGSDTGTAGARGPDDVLMS